MTLVAAKLNVSIDRSKHTVLVVDDNPATCYATARALRAAGFKTIEAGTGQEALALSTGEVSAVVLDVHLPDIDGFEVCRLIRAREETMSIPIVHLSAAFIEDSDKIAGLNAGADAYLTHPAEPAMLIATVQALVRARQAEESVHESESKFRSIYAQTQSGIALVDAEGRLQDANPAMLEMLGRPAEDVLGHLISEFAAPGHQDRIQTSMRAGAVETTLWREEFVLLTGQGQMLHVEWSMSPGTNAATSAVHPHHEMRVAAVSNVSDRIQLEAERKLLLEREQAARANAERHSRTKDDFVAVLSHELRNPLSAIMLNVHQLLRKSPPAEYAKGLDAIQRNASTQARLISDILDVSRINSGKLTLKREWVDPALLVSASLDSLTSMIDSKKLALTLDLRTDGTLALLDAARFQQIFWNILSNAVKFSDHGHPLSVILDSKNEKLRLVVRDHGKGIDQPFIERIFEKFTQEAMPANRSSGGLGLGMSIVKHLVELHSGRVSVQSDGLGKGTTVTVTIPIVGPTTDDDYPPDSGPAPLDASLEALRGVRVLIVEDDLEAAKILMLILQDQGAVVECVQDYEAALTTLQSFGADVIVSDIGLPGKDGYALIRHVRAAGGALARVPAIALTAFGREVDRDVAFDAGFDVHLAKPLEPQKLVWAIRRIIDADPRT